MTRSQFILGLALLVVSGTLAFIVTFRQQEDAEQRVAQGALNRGHSSFSTKDSAGSHPTKVRHRPNDPTNYEITVSQESQREDALRVERESLAQLEKMTARYQLTRSQRRQIFPLIAKHHADFKNGMMVNGQITPVPPAEALLASEVYPLLETNQQDAYQEDILAKDQWWSEIIVQLRTDLDEAIESGDIIITSDTISEDLQDP